MNLPGRMMYMTRAKKSVIAAAAALCMMIAMVPALALGGIDMNESGSVTFDLSNETFREDMAETVLQVDVYQLATVNEGGIFTLTGSFAALADIPQWNGGLLDRNTDLEALTTAAMALIAPETPAEDEADETPAEAAIPPLETVEVKAVEGSIDLSPWGLGLYLLLPADAETGLWRYTFSPVLLSVPSVRQPADTPSDGGEWVYSVPVFLKPEQGRRLTEIVIYKELLEYNATLGPTTFVFEVTAADDTGAVVYSNVAALTVSGAGTQTVTVSGIPVGCDVTVREIYSGGSYTPVNGAIAVPIEDLPPAVDGSVNRVDFTNTYTNERIPDTAVVNTYVWSGSGWRWTGGQSEEAGA